MYLHVASYAVSPRLQANRISRMLVLDLLLDLLELVQVNCSHE